jgi:hypothetical protein
VPTCEMAQMIPTSHPATETGYSPHHFSTIIWLRN